MLLCELLEQIALENKLHIIPSRARKIIQEKISNINRVILTYKHLFKTKCTLVISYINITKYFAIIFLVCIGTCDFSITYITSSHL